jgi:hypothetical protein
VAYTVIERIELFSFHSTTAGISEDFLSFFLLCLQLTALNVFTFPLFSMEKENRRISNFTREMK